MTSRHLSIRMDETALARLEAEGRRQGVTKSELAKTLLDEGLRMQQHPGILFRPGPAGRRPGLVSGPDVWEVMRVFRDVGRRGDAGIQATADWGGLTLEQVRTAMRYYAEYQDE